MTRQEITGNSTCIDSLCKPGSYSLVILRSSARAPTIKTVRRTVAIEAVFDNLKGHLFPLRGGGSVPLAGPLVLLLGGSVPLTSCSVVSLGHGAFNCQGSGVSVLEKDPSAFVVKTIWSLPNWGVSGLQIPTLLVSE